MQSHDRILIVGGGLSGMATAWKLAAEGRDVLVLESSRPGSGASTRNEGWLHSGGWFARSSRELAEQCHLGLQDTVSQFPGCLEDDCRGMLYLISTAGDAVDRWIAAWEEAGIPFTGIPESQTVERVPELRDSASVRGFLLPDRSARFDVLIRELHERALACGAEVRLRSHVARLLIDDDSVTGVELADGERLAAGTVVLAGNARGMDLLRQVTPDFPGSQPSCQCVSMRTHLLALPHATQRDAFCMPDESGLHHLPHGDQSIFGLSRWQPVADLADESADRHEQEALRERVFEALDIAPPGDRVLDQWAGVTVHAMRPEQVVPGEAPLPVVVDYSTESPSLRNLFGIFPGRATLWNSVASQVQLRLQHS